MKYQTIILGTLGVGAIVAGIVLLKSKGTIVTSNPVSDAQVDTTKKDSVLVGDGVKKYLAPDIVKSQPVTLENGIVNRNNPVGGNIQTLAFDGKYSLTNVFI